MIPQGIRVHHCVDGINFAAIRRVYERFVWPNCFSGNLPDCGDAESPEPGDEGRLHCAGVFFADTSKRGDGAGND